MLPINLPKTDSIINLKDLHKPLTKGLMTLNGQIEIQARNILEQIDLLKKQAQQVENKKIISKKIYSSEIKFEPIITGIYYLYIRNGRDKFISMVGPTEWGRSLKSNLEYMATIQLQYDHTWKILHTNFKNYFYE